MNVRMACRGLDAMLPVNSNAMVGVHVIRLTAQCFRCTTPNELHLEMQLHEVATYYIKYIIEIDVLMEW